MRLEMNGDSSVRWFGKQFSLDFPMLMTALFDLPVRMMPKGVCSEHKPEGNRDRASVTKSRR